MNYKLEKLHKFIDRRGDLIVFLKNSELQKKQNIFGQIYFVTFSKKGVTRGNHFHKKWTEWFGIVNGKVEVLLEDVSTHEQVKIILDSKHDKYLRLNIGPNIAHAFKSITKEASLLNYADSEWSENDTIPYKIIPKQK